MSTPDPPSPVVLRRQIRAGLLVVPETVLRATLATALLTVLATALLSALAPRVTRACPPTTTPGLVDWPTNSRAIAAVRSSTDLLHIQRTGEIRHLFVHSNPLLLEYLMEFLTVEVYPLSDPDASPPSDPDASPPSDPDASLPSEPEAGTGEVETGDPPLAGTTTLEMVADDMLFLRWMPDEPLDSDRLHRIDLHYVYQAYPNDPPIRHVFSREEVDWLRKPEPLGALPDLAQLSQAAERVSPSMGLAPSPNAWFVQNCCVRHTYEEGECWYESHTALLDCDFRVASRRPELLVIASLDALDEASAHDWVTWWEIEHELGRRVLTAHQGHTQPPRLRYAHDADAGPPMEVCSRLFALNPEDPSDVLQGESTCIALTRPDPPLAFYFPDPGPRQDCGRRVNSCRDATDRWCEAVQERPEIQDAIDKAQALRESPAEGESHEGLSTGEDPGADTRDPEATASDGEPEDEPFTSGSGCSLYSPGIPSPLPLALLTLLALILRRPTRPQVVTP